MTLKNDEKSEEELTCRFKIDIRNLRNFFPPPGKTTFKKPSLIRVKYQRGVMFHDNEA